MTKFRLFATAAMLCLAQAASASILVASDNFNYADGPLAGQAGGSGWLTAWGGTAAVVAGTAVQFTGATDVSTAATRTLSKTQSGDVLVDFTLSFSSSLTGQALEDNDFLGLYFGSPTGSSIGLKANCGGTTPPCTRDLFVRNSGTTREYLANSDLKAGQTYHVFGHLYKSNPAGNYDNFAAWIDPTADEMANLTTPDALYVGTSGVASFDTIGFRKTNLNDVVVTVDSLNISNVPEPGSIALLGLALLGMVGVQRRNRR